VVGRRQVKLVEVMSECGDKCLAVGGDFSNVEDMVRVRDAVEEGGQAITFVRRDFAFGRRIYA